MTDMSDAVYREATKAKMLIAGLVALAYFAARCAKIIATDWGFDEEA